MCKFSLSKLTNMLPFEVLSVGNVIIFSFTLGTIEFKQLIPIFVQLKGTFIL